MNKPSRLLYLLQSAIMALQWLDRVTFSFSYWPNVGKCAIVEASGNDGNNTENIRKPLHKGGKN